MNRNSIRDRLRMTFEVKVLLTSLGGGLPACLVGTICLFQLSLGEHLRWTLLAVISIAWILSATLVRMWISETLQAISTVNESMHHHDFSRRLAQQYKPGDALSRLIEEMNTYADARRRKRLHRLEADLLVQAVITEIDIAVFAFDENCYICLANRAAAKLFGKSPNELLGLNASAMGLLNCLEGETPRLIDSPFPDSHGTWEVRRRRFRSGGAPHVLLVLSDITRSAHQQELMAWRRLLNVIGHELNNSLGSIRSIANSLTRVAALHIADPNAADETIHGLEIIAARSHGLLRFSNGYVSLRRLPPPNRHRFDLTHLLLRVTQFEDRVPVVISDRQPRFVSADEHQLEQLLINIIRNAADASLETQGSVSLSFGISTQWLELFVDDDGHGVIDSKQLFVPFYTTKPHGCGIGLFLSRQIAEAHGGSLSLVAKPGSRGCRAVIRLPNQDEDYDNNVTSIPMPVHKVITGPLNEL